MTQQATYPTQSGPSKTQVNTGYFNPVDEDMFSKKSTTWIGGPTHAIQDQHIPLYTGHIHGLESENLFGKTYARLTNDSFRNRDERGSLFLTQSTRDCTRRTTKPSTRTISKIQECRHQASQERPQFSTRTSTRPRLTSTRSLPALILTRWHRLTEFQWWDIKAIFLLSWILCGSSTELRRLRNSMMLVGDLENHRIMLRMFRSLRCLVLATLGS